MSEPDKSWLRNLEDVDILGGDNGDMLGTGELQQAVITLLSCREHNMCCVLGSLVLRH